ncbi:EamA family transporter [Pandoraea apista]|uniref:ABC transporter permease n=1 Tax=Pandoraea apista TaxID=93218 RepID=A0A5E5P7E7_9BURK|nr:EamA family transporter [Pandoraea apista]AVF41871.1 EamA family transporter [Pandoraea apista]OXS97673.1 EamA family transporter [Pandoraea apista]PTD99304.1 EamA family transporter [Pandoraea apista]RRJ29336.1 EamA family transporter [Pandoraea apista]RRJ73794.1 EamA family transporter [Pandoraea apista]
MTTTTSSLPVRWIDALLTALAPMIWGSTYIVTTQLLPPDRPFTAALIRVLPSGLLLLLYARRWPERRDWGRLVVLAALNIGAFQALLFVAAYRLPGGLAAVVGAIQPLLVMGLAWGVEQRRPLAATAWAALAGVVGMAVLLLSPGTVFEPVGILAALAGAASMATGTYLTRRWRLNMPVLALTGWQLLLGGLMLAPVAWLADAPLPALTMWQTLGYLYLSIAGALLAYALWFRGIARLAPVAVSSLGLLSPLTAVVLGWVLLGQAIKGFAFVGLATVFASILAVQWTASRT